MPASESRPGICWYCRARPGGEHSVALPFWSKQEDAVQVLVLPRCGACADFHLRRQFPSGMLIVAGAAAGALPASLLPLEEPLRGIVIVAALIVGFALGFVLAAHRDEWRARRRGTRPVSDYVQHPPYRALATDTEHWRQSYAVGSGAGPNPGHRTVAELAAYFTGIADEPIVIAALARGCADAGLAWTPAQRVH
jgi:hypothetical protein